MQGQQEKDGIGMKKLPCVSERERGVCVCVSFFLWFLEKMQVMRKKSDGRKGSSGVDESGKVGL